MYKRVLFTQFGIPDLDTLEYKSNVPLAAGYLAAFSKKKFSKTEFIITPRIVTDILCEKEFFKFVDDIKPDLFLFSLYIWNIEKTLRVSEKLKLKYPSVKILFGGPEVNPDNDFLLSSNIFENGIVGEGEIPLNEFLSGIPIENISGALIKASNTLTKNIYNPPNKIRTTFELDENPYLENLIEDTPDSTMYFETVRGCPFKCNFCYYNKVYDKIIPMNTEHISHYLDYARERGIHEIFLLDPSFNAQPNFEDLLDELIRLNQDNFFEFSTELRADLLTEDLMKKLKKLNLADAEIGLQTINPDVLMIMNRSSSAEKTIIKAKKMNNLKIKTKIDLIAGLPGDNLISFKKTVDRVFNENLHKDIQVFRLSVLSGTEFSVNRDKYNIKAYSKPPYFIESTDTFSNVDILSAINYAREKFEIDLYYLPQFLLSSNFKYLRKNKFVKFDSDIKPVHKLTFKNYNSKSYKDLENLSESLVLHFSISNPEKDSVIITKIIDHFMTEFPFNTYQFVFEYTNNFTEESLLNLLKHIDLKTSYIDRDASGYFGDCSVTRRIALIMNKKYYDSNIYRDMCNDFDVFLTLDICDEDFIIEASEENKLYFKGNDQEKIFKLLKNNDLLSEFTIFDLFKFEYKKFDIIGSGRLYYPYSIEI